MHNRSQYIPIHPIHARHFANAVTVTRTRAGSRRTRRPAGRRTRRRDPSGTLRYMISYMISEVPDIKLISYDIDVYDIIRL